VTFHVDAHAHIYDSTREVGSGGVAFPAAEVDVAALRADMLGAEVAGAVLVQPSAYGRDHNLLVSCLKSGRYAGVGLVDASALAPGDVDGEVRRLSDLGLCGVRVHLDEATMPISRAAAKSAARLGLVLDVHVQEPAWALLWEIASISDGATIVVDHLGRPHDPTSLPASAFLRAVQVRDNVVLKMSGFEVISRSGFPYKDMAQMSEQALAYLGPDRLMWASNFPYCRGSSYAALLDAFQDLADMDEQTRSAVLGGTASRVFSVPGGAD
jgi:predicted TIM-barrel fold metal-dependent hydrolase